jgi:formate hydrogenlyase subunit 6/NADH:ubiquinone oxidoreductase subunit I
VVKRLRSWLYLLPELWRTLVRRPVTVSYPRTPLELPEGYRGRVVMDPESCRGCGLCVRDCPAFALELERRDKESFRLLYHPDRCAYCGQCEVSCHFGALRLTNAFVSATDDRGTLTVILVDR